MKRSSSWVMAAVSGLAWPAPAGTVCWDFGAASGSAAPTSSSAANLAAGAVSQGNNNGTTALLTNLSQSKDYAGASAEYNAGAAARTGALSTAASGSAYFAFTLTPAAGCALSVTNVSFGSRSTATGPQLFSVRSSLDAYASDLTAGTLETNSTWALKGAPMAAASPVAGTAITVRIYGHGGVGSPPAGTANWRIDDLSVGVSAVNAGGTTPPLIEPVAAQAVRVGQTLTFVLTVTATDGDPVTATNCTSAAAGAWSLAGGVFSYTPAAGDAGERDFAFTAADKDGASAAMTVAVTVRRAQLPAVRMTALTGTYAQDFDTLPTNGAALLWDNAAEPLEAWYAYAGALPAASFAAGKGEETAGALYAYGSDGGADRALGSLASSGTGELRYGVAFTNETAATVTNLTVAYRGEQWRCASNAVQALAFGYCVTNAVIPLPQGCCRWATSLFFESPHTTNLAAGCVPGAGLTLAASLPALVPPGGVVLLCWRDTDDGGADHGLAVDDLSVGWAAGTAPAGIPVGRAGASERFDDIGPDADAMLPPFWRIEARDDAPRTNGAYGAAPEQTLRANTTTNVVNAGSYNFASACRHDQAVGGLSSDSAAKSVTVFAKFVNAAGTPLRSWTVRYGVEKYRRGSASCAVRLLASTDGQAWAAAGAPTAFAADADVGMYALDERPGAAVAVERQVAFGKAVEAGEVFYLAWQYAVAEGSDTSRAQALGIDDVQVLPRFPAVFVLMLQ